MIDIEEELLLDHISWSITNPQFQNVIDNLTKSGFYDETGNTQDYKNITARDTDYYSNILIHFDNIYFEIITYYDTKFSKYMDYNALNIFVSSIEQHDKIVNSGIIQNGLILQDHEYYYFDKFGDKVSSINCYYYNDKIHYRNQFPDHSYKLSLQEVDLVTSKGGFVNYAKIAKNMEFKIDGNRRIVNSRLPTYKENECINLVLTKKHLSEKNSGLTISFHDKSKKETQQLNLL